MSVYDAVAVLLFVMGYALGTLWRLNAHTLWTSAAPVPFLTIGNIGLTMLVLDGMWYMIISVPQLAVLALSFLLSTLVALIIWVIQLVLDREDRQYVVTSISRLLERLKHWYYKSPAILVDSSAKVVAASKSAAQPRQRNATLKTVRASSEAEVTHKRTFHGVPFHIETLSPTRLSWSGALSSEDNTGNNVSELEVDVRVIPLSQLFDPAILELHVPWAGPALRLVKAPREASESAVIYRVCPTCLTAKAGELLGSRCGH